MSSLWQRGGKKMESGTTERAREKGSCKQRLSHENWTCGPAQHVLSFGKLKRRKENGISTKGKDRVKEYSQHI
jgi:hypothetical protein